MTSPWILIVTFAMGTVSSLIGVMIGAYAVYRTKRDSYEPFFPTSSKGESFNVDDDLTLVDNQTGDLDSNVSGANERFVQQFAENLAGRKAG